MLEFLIYRTWAIESLLNWVKETAEKIGQTREDRESSQLSWNLSSQISA